MTTCRIGQLTRTQLNAAVAQSVGAGFRIEGDVVWILPGEAPPAWLPSMPCAWHPTDDIQQAWPLVRHYRISLSYSDTEEATGTAPYCWGMANGLEYDDEDELVALMRTLVALRHGPEFNLDLLAMNGQGVSAGG